MVGVARERMVGLLREAELSALAGHPERSDRYVQLARRIGTRYNVRLPPELRHRFCRGCSSYLREGSTVRTRLRSGRQVRTCLKCGRAYRTPLMRTKRRTEGIPGISGGPMVEPLGVPVDELGEDEGSEDEGLDEA